MEGAHGHVKVKVESVSDDEDLDAPCLLVVDRAVDELIVLPGPDWVVTESDYQDYRAAFVDISSEEELEE